ncbi:hypothetical protein QQF64_002079 [Cirrhinus molitorella]|uniref:G-protein coupled receptors family 1 profile domain-containing protein n=1 Tax=Cirrhinus molitorella TaxID=172907 RepID=A0ABR3MP52_9TELE
MFSSTCSTTMISVLLAEIKTVSYNSCISRTYFYHLGDFAECMALTLMAIDRLIAIRHPLRYHSIVTTSRILLFIFLTWLAGFAIMGYVISMAANVPYYVKLELIVYASRNLRVDFGASGNFISSCSLDWFRIPCSPNDISYQISNIQGKPLGKVLVHHRMPESSPRNCPEEPESILPSSIIVSLRSAGHSMIRSKLPLAQSPLHWEVQKGEPMCHPPCT